MQRVNCLEREWQWKLLIFCASVSCPSLSPLALTGATVQGLGVPARVRSSWLDKNEICKNDTACGALDRGMHRVGRTERWGVGIVWLDLVRAVFPPTAFTSLLGVGVPWVCSPMGVRIPKGQSLCRYFRLSVGLLSGTILTSTTGGRWRRMGF